jgi:hypothetical protein
MIVGASFPSIFNREEVTVNPVDGNQPNNYQDDDPCWF